MVSRSSETGTAEENEMNTIRQLSGLSVEVDSEAYVAGRDEDGRDFTAERFYVTATDRFGNRWNHEQLFFGCSVEANEDGYNHFIDTRDVAKARANRLADRIQATGKIDLSFWHTGRPVYGSGAYVSYGQDDDRLLEMEEG
jgi:hypothetical protein